MTISSKDCLNQTTTAATHHASTENTTADDHRYDDMLCLPHPTSSRHPRMSLSDRAAQFAPFSALSGYDSAILETARFTDRRMELTEDEQSLLDRRLLFLQEHRTSEYCVTVTYFIQDTHREEDCGSYTSLTGIVKKADPVERYLLMKDGTRIAIPDIFALDGDFFDE